MFNRSRKTKTERKPFLRLRKRSKGESPSLVRVSPESPPDDDDLDPSPMSPKGCDKDDVQLLNFGLAFGAGVVLGMIIKK